jgi:hypothetical protein
VREELVAALGRDQGVHPYGKWRGAFWRLLSLVELGAGVDDPGVAEAADHTLDWLASPRRLAEIHKRKIDGRVRRCASQDGRGLWACCRLGVADERMNTLAGSLVETQWPDGGWNCDRHRECTHSSFNETWRPIQGLAEYGATEAAAGAAKRGAEFLLRHRLVFSERTGKPAHPVFLQLAYPAYWHYDVLVGLTTLQRSVGLDDPRASDALDLLESKRLEDGTWRVERRWWKRPGSKGSGVEAVDWGTGANELLSDRAAEMLLAAGRA